MQAALLKQKLKDGALGAYAHLYRDVQAQTARILSAIDTFEKMYGKDRDISVFSVPGRSEISGNHTDHNRGMVLAGAIDRDIIAVAAKNDDGVVRFHSEHYPEDTVNVTAANEPKNFRQYSSCALVAGVLSGIQKRGYAVGGYDAYSTTEVLKGSGISSSAAFEVMVGNVLNYLYNDGKIPNTELAKVAQYAENVYFGKPCGLMDQMACAVGGFVFMDFENPEDTKIEQVDFSLSAAGYSLCIINTGGNHANLTPDYAAIPAEMKSVAAFFGKEHLRGVTETEIVSALPALRKKLSDRACLRALHFVRENGRVEKLKTTLKNKDVNGFFALIGASGDSSFKYLQNVYPAENPEEQGLSVALALAEGFLQTHLGACRVHGGGFAGTVQAFVKNEDTAAFASLMNGVFGDGACMCLSIRPVGATKLF